ncbi:MAG: hypothetical protein KYX69_02180 [Sphingomonas sp.]|uniref:hypothetical protein n=1 Tax=Sphingomonas sp. TaxID=28214 RepID=UPI002601CC83|nr:hypothetical protein [Sphingomonas sp.]MDK2766506.1 hypothetical protein [Sphingomonas sp.]
MSEQSNMPPAKRWPWWLYVMGAALGAGASRVMSAFWSNMSAAGRETFIGIAAIIIAGILSYAVYRFIRTW